jgi:hypothetical protein
MTKPEAEDDIASGEENHGCFPETRKYTCIPDGRGMQITFNII